MKIIKVELLKWCPAGFRVKRLSHNFFSFLGYNSDYKRTIGNMVEGEDFDKNYVVAVDAGEYEKAVINSIKEMLPKHLMLKHITKLYGGALVFYGDDKFIHVLADPRPWEDEYTIEIPQ